MGPFGFKVTTSCVTVIEIYFLELNGFRVASRKVTREKEIRKKKKKETSFLPSCLPPWLSLGGWGRDFLWASLLQGRRESVSRRKLRGTKVCIGPAAILGPPINILWLTLSLGPNWSQSPREQGSNRRPGAHPRAGHWELSSSVWLREGSVFSRFTLCPRSEWDECSVEGKGLPKS